MHIINYLYSNLCTNLHFSINLLAREKENVTYFLILTIFIESETDMINYVFSRVILINNYIYIDSRTSRFVYLGTVWIF